MAEKGLISAPNAEAGVPFNIGGATGTYPMDGATRNLLAHPPEGK
jgi:hypothetical protein